jgi:hypothetical protein
LGPPLEGEGELEKVKRMAAALQKKREPEPPEGFLFFLQIAVPQAIEPATTPEI